MQEFSPADAEGIVKALSYPRLPGSPGAAKAVSDISSMFEKIGMTLTKEGFLASTAMFGRALELEMASTIAIAAVMAIVSHVAPALNLFLVAGTAIAVIVVLNMLSAGKSRPTTRGVPTFNLSCAVPPLKSKRGTVLFMAHHDTKSQSLTALQRVACFVGWAITLLEGLALFAIIGIIDITTSGTSLEDQARGTIATLNLVAVTSVVVLACFTIPLALNKVGNESPGSLDNASGVAAVYMLAKAVKANPFHHLEARFLITGAEELGLFGAKEYLAKHGPELPPASTWVLNFDTMGSIGGKVEVLESMGFPVPRKVSPLLFGLARDAASSLGHEFSRIYLPIGAATDRMVFSRKGIEGIDFGCRRGASVIHTGRDAPGMLDPALAAKVTAVGHRVAMRLDERAQKA
nr:M28 family peptidase [Candidatus Sigynarchaeum springense]